MTKASLFPSPRFGASAEIPLAARAVAIGRYTFTPAATCSPPEAGATLRRDGAEVELRVTESLLVELLTRLDAAQQELGPRWHSQPHSDRNASRTSQAAHFRE